MKYIYITVLFFCVLFFPGASTASFEVESKYCVEHDGKFDVQFVSNFDNEGYGVCVFKDGSECMIDNYMNGTCTPGQSLLPNLRVDLRSGGWVKDKNHPKNHYDYTDENNSQFYYYEVSVQNQNSSTGSFSSDPTTMMVYSDPIKKIDIPTLKPGEYTEVFKFYIPSKKIQVVDLEINPDKLVREKDYTDNTIYSRSAYVAKDKQVASGDVGKVDKDPWRKFLNFILKLIF